MRVCVSNYKDTLNLPSTAFPMKANLAGREPDRIWVLDASGAEDDVQ